MIVPWMPQPSPDGIRAASWRVRLLVRIGSLVGPTHSGFFQTTVDCGALWTTFTQDFARSADIADITTGLETRVRWMGIDHAAWQHRVKLTIAIDPHAVDTITPDPFDVLFIRRFPHPATRSSISLAVLGMDALALLRLTLDGPSAATRF